MDPSTPPPTRRSKRPDLTRDQRIRVQAYRDDNWSYPDIAAKLNISERQVRHVIDTARATPKKRTGRPPVLSDADVDELITYISQSRGHRQLSFQSLADGPFAHWQRGPYAIRSALRKRGYRRYRARAKPPLSAANKERRLAWALEHREWTPDQWASILWTDETWVTGGHHYRPYVTRRKDEEIHESCVVDKLQRRRGWMFWGSFNGNEKGPCVFWEKEWGSINKVSYSERIVPVIDGWIRSNPGLQLMQDGAPGHAAADTLAELRDRGIVPIFWPPYSPDLNPIEKIWNKMKTWLDQTYGDSNFTYDRLREVVKEAWDAITTEYLQDLISTMPQRCEDVIQAQGGHTTW
jgi:transposase